MNDRKKIEMSHGTEVLLGLFVIFVGAQIVAEVAQRLKFPAVVGEVMGHANRSKYQEDSSCILGPSMMQ